MSMVVSRAVSFDRARPASLRPSSRSISSGLAADRRGNPVGSRKSACKRGFGRYICEFHGLSVAGVAQSAEHRFCKPTVVSSTLTASSDLSSWASAFGRRTRDDSAIRHLDGSSETGWIPKWLKGPDCKSGGICLRRFESCSTHAPPSRGRLDSRSSTQSERSRPETTLALRPRPRAASPFDRHLLRRGSPSRV